MAAVRPRRLHVPNVLVEPAVRVNKVLAAQSVGDEIGADFASEPGVREVVAPELIGEGTARKEHERWSAFAREDSDWFVKRTGRDSFHRLEGVCIQVLHQPSIKGERDARAQTTPSGEE